ncbi:translocation protein S66 [Steccherinum ochraceum]|uniref:Translocation protein S66 n=1 Tax=Steccherinum ochraceum TaxID=92696 RepID=A0A4R0R600_9APHY|nr:translocation protein S66 [Steccherinum ochraceum]
MASIYIPLLYLFSIFGGLWIFSGWYRRRIASKEVEPYFPRHKERDIYITLLQRTDPPTPEHLLKAALVRRAMTDVQRILRLREDKPALQQLLQKGSIGDDLFNSLLAAEKELEAEILEVAAEANTFVEGWGQIIFQTATEMLHNEKIRAILEQVPVLRLETEKKYGIKSASTSAKAIPPAILAPVVAPASPAVSSPASIPLPLTPGSARPSNGALSPQSAGAESSFSSDGESPNSPSSPRTPKVGTS